MTDKPVPMMDPELADALTKLRQTQFVLSAVIAQRDDAMNKLADATATIAMLQGN